MKSLSSLRDNQDGTTKLKKPGCMKVFVVAGILLLCASQLELDLSYDAIFGDRVSEVDKSSSSSSSHDEQWQLCDSKACIAKQGIQLARVFPDRSADTGWKRGKSYGDSGHEGILLVKMPKAASSTSAGAAIRIAKHNPEAHVRYFHIMAHSKQYGNRHPHNSYLFTTVRNPDSRAMSRVFFTHISQNRVEPTDERIRQLLDNKDLQLGVISRGQGGFQVAYGAFEKIADGYHWNSTDKTTVLHFDQLIQQVQHMIDNYDFIIPSERLDEGLVAMTIRMGLPVSDVLYSSSKGAGSYYLRREPRECVKIQDKFVSPAIQTYLDSPEWRAQNYGDYLFHAAANRSLDLTIDDIGRQHFDKALAEFQRLKAIVNEVCAHRTNFPCSEDGQDQEKISAKNCYYRDSGCGYPCIDEVVLNDSRLPKTTSSANTTHAHRTTTTSANTTNAHQSVTIHGATSIQQCESKECMKEQGYQFARVFPDRSADTSWETPSSYGDQGHQGILLVKMPKAASSTSAGVALRIAHRNGGEESTAVRYMHALASKMNYGYRHPQSSYLFTTVRGPDSRAISRVFFTDVSQKNRKPTDENIIHALNDCNPQFGTISNGQGGFQLAYGALEKIPVNYHYNANDNATTLLHFEKLLERVQHTIDNYDFIIPTERLDEGLVAMMIRLGIPLENALYSSSKSAGSFHLLRTRQICVKIKDKFISPRIQQYLDSPEWKAQNYGDYVLHAATHKSLDLTIDAIGHERFQKALKEFQQLKDKINDVCANQTHFPCSNDGQAQEALSKKNCYYKDAGCGYACIDEMIANETLIG